tara:strand:+ start:510 stop:1259 length:750 start_codon:yes stop_codon:yes gene_type:complete
MSEAGGIDQKKRHAKVLKFLPTLVKRTGVSIDPMLTAVGTSMLNASDMVLGITVAENVAEESRDQVRFACDTIIRSEFADVARVQVFFPPDDSVGSLVPTSFCAERAEFDHRAIVDTLLSHMRQFTQNCFRAHLLAAVNHLPWQDAAHMRAKAAHATVPAALYGHLAHPRSIATIFALAVDELVPQFFRQLPEHERVLIMEICTRERGRRPITLFQLYEDVYHLYFVKGVTAVRHTALAIFDTHLISGT